VGRIEHVNLTVSNPERTARMLEQLFGWQVRWDGPNRSGGRTIHVGSENAYIALSSANNATFTEDNFAKGRPLNHIGVEVDDLDSAHARVMEAGLDPGDYDIYEPGLRFYFFDHDGVEFEVVSYAPAGEIRQQDAA
jgi:catechol 2,3-dioxygenase-like lactoylglutathione lyase family enzyme